jgi:hypothetical protein
MLHTAYRGSLFAEGATKTEAKQNLEPMIDWAVAHHAPHIELRDGYTIVIAATATGWESQIISPSPHNIAARKTIPCTRFYGPIERKSVIKAEREHVAKMIQILLRDSGGANTPVQAHLERFKDFWR